MSFGKSLIIALFCILVVFAVLIVLWALVRIFSGIIQFFEKRTRSKS